MIFILNILWFVLGGFFAGLGWVLAGIIMAITIVGIPWARSCFMIARYTFWPFGYDLVSRDELTGRQDLGTGTLGTIGNVIWFVLAGGSPQCTSALPWHWPFQLSASPLRGRM
jgi:uncharacterized membrane protein YccF (DUF307 family)